ncbi:hypothetical protein ACFW04_012808 [Cataglyphis niger]
MAVYTSQEYYDMLMVLGECHVQQNHAARRYVELYPNRRHPSGHVILAAAQRLYDTGNVLPNKHDTGRDRCIRNIRRESIRIVARENNLSYSIIQRILTEEKLHAFHYTRMQHLRPADYPARQMFYPKYSSRVIFSDESLFTQQGIFNVHNMHFWSEENPRESRDFEIFKLLFFLNVLTGRSYVDFLTENLPDFLEDVPLFERNEIVFQQDGAGPHNARIVTNYLNEHFPGRWMGRYGPIRWLARSLDLNPLDFFLWGYCKEVIYKTLPEDIEEQETRLRHAIWNVDEEIMENVKINLLKRMRACVRMDGGHFDLL